MEFPGLVQSLIDVLREKIITGELAPGQNINELEISKSFNVSRSPLREALKVLENEGLIHNIPRKGSSVSGISLVDLSEIYQMREMIECYAIDLFKEKEIRRFPADCHPVLGDMRNLEVPSEDASAKQKLKYIESLAEFHMELVQSTGNQRLYEYYKTIHSNINRYVFLHAFISGVSEHRVNDHVMITECLEKGQYIEARKIIKSHIRLSYEDLRARIK